MKPDVLESLERVADMKSQHDADKVLMQRAAKEIKRLRAALELIEGQHCKTFTTGLGSCFKNGRTPDAEYLADRCCNPCIAHRALHAQ